MHRTLSHYGLSADSWSGADASPSAADAYAGQTYYYGGSRVQIIGQYNSGTNLLNELLIRNFPHDEDDSGVGACKFWKHASLSNLQTRHASTLEACGQVVGIAMIRNPLNWLLSCKREFYDLYACNKGDDWLRTACRYPDGSPAYLGGNQYENVERIWSSWTHDYSSLQSFGFNQSLAIKYEDLVMDTEGQLDIIAQTLGIDFSGDVEQVDEAVHPTAVDKEHGRELAIQKIVTRSYLESFSKQDLEDACSRLDRELMRQHGYSDCDDLFPVEDIPSKG